MTDRFILGVRSQHWFGLVSRTLGEMGISDWEVVPPRGRGHPKLVVRHGGKTLKTPVPCTERGGGDHKYLINRIRKAFAA